MSDPMTERVNRIPWNLGSDLVSIQTLYCHPDWSLDYCLEYCRRIVEHIHDANPCIQTPPRYFYAYTARVIQ